MVGAKGVLSWSGAGARPVEARRRATIESRPECRSRSRCAGADDCVSVGLTTVFDGGNRVEGTNYAVIGQLYQQQPISVAGCGGGWCQIYLQGGRGFVSQSYVYPVSGRR